MTNRRVPWPPFDPFPESTRETHQRGGPDFPESGGDREHGKFRPSATPRLTTVAVVGDDGQPIGTALVPNFADLIEELRKLRFALMLNGQAADLGDLENGV